MNEPTYQEKLAAWKLKHGLPDGEEINEVELAMLVEDKNNSNRSWCIGCDAEMPIKEMRLITLRIDPYKQMHEGPGDYIPDRDRVRMCPACFKEHYTGSEL